MSERIIRVLIVKRIKRRLTKIAPSFANKRDTSGVNLAWSVTNSLGLPFFEGKRPHTDTADSLRITKCGLMGE